MRQGGLRSSILSLRAWIPLILALVTAGLIVAFSGVASAQTGLTITVRDTIVEADGTTRIVVNVAGPSMPDVLPDDAFQVSEGGVPVEGLTVEPFFEDVEPETVIVGLTIDVSGSMAGEPMAQTIDGASDLVADLADRGMLVQLFSFATVVETLTSPSTNSSALVDQIQQLVPAGNTALYDAVVVGVDALATVEAERYLVVFSDGADTSSDATLDEAIAAAQATEIPVTVVVLESPDFDIEPLRQMADSTGGQVVTAATAADLSAAFEQVARDLASQYRLTYIATDHASDTLNLSVAVEFAGAASDLDFVVANLREAPEAPPPTPRTFTAPPPGPLASPALLIGGLGAAFLSVLLVAAFLFMSARTRADRVLDSQLARYISGRDTRAGRSSHVAAHFRDRAMEMLEGAPRPKGFDERLTKSLEQAAWPLRNGEFLALVLLAALAVGAVTGLIAGPFAGLLLGLGAGSIPVLILARRKSRRQDAFLRALPDSLQLLAGSLRAGYAILQAIDSVAKESHPPTSEEFGRVLTEARLGMPIEDALEAMAERLDSPDFRWVVLAINIQREVGGNLAELLDIVAEVLREREMLRRQIKVLSAEGRLSAVILVLLPILLTLYMIVVRPEYIGTLITSGIIGWLMIWGAVLLMVGGTLWIRKMIRIEV